MKSILVVDITGRTVNYGTALYEALVNNKQDELLHYIYPGKGLLKLIPSKYSSSENIIKRMLKVVEGLLNYCILIFRIILRKYDVIHFQWLPFLEKFGIEIYVLKVIKKIVPQCTVVLTVHNIYPHNLDSIGKEKYNYRFVSASRFINKMIVHTQISKQDVQREFHMNETDVHVCCHGVFVPKQRVILQNRKNDKIRILQFGNQSFYKGTDLLVDAVNKLEPNKQDLVDVHVIGGISSKYLGELKAKDSNALINWKPYYLTNDELYDEINNCDIIVLPYRAISQSGVLLLSIYFGKYIICSNLPSFMETMTAGFTLKEEDGLFFDSESSNSLRDVINKYLDGSIDKQAIENRIKYLKQLYTWDNAAKATLMVYMNDSTKS